MSSTAFEEVAFTEVHIDEKETEILANVIPKISNPFELISKHSFSRENSAILIKAAKLNPFVQIISLKEDI